MGKNKNIGIGRGTSGSPQTSIEQSNLESKVKDLSKSMKYNIDYDKNKLENYLLNPSHSEGSSKAKFLKETLGYSKGDSLILHTNIVSSIDGITPYSTEETNYGKKLKFKTKLRGKDGSYHAANVVVVIQNDKGKINYRIITLYPGKKEGK